MVAEKTLGPKAVIAVRLHKAEKAFQARHTARSTVPRPHKKVRGGGGGSSGPRRGEGAVTGDPPTAANLVLARCSEPVTSGGGEGGEQLQAPPPRMKWDSNKSTVILAPRPRCG